MTRTLKWISAVIALLALAFIAYRLSLPAEAKLSPQETVLFEKNGLRIEVTYGRPWKKDRKIFGELVPYGKVWRTGANEATVFISNHDLVVDGKKLRAGKYSLWTIPQPDKWIVIFNSKMYPWGVNFEEQALREAAFDAIAVEIPVETTPELTEQFAITIEDLAKPELVMKWEHTMVRVPLK
ncbi:MAG: DUF2911 domain-containing protein [Bacteroidota bacterium]